MKDGSILQNDILSSLLLNEPHPTIQDPLTLPRGDNIVNESKRNSEVKWMINMGKKLDLGLDTVGAAVAIFDNILTSLSVQFKYANCVAATSLYIAIKLLEEGLDSIGLEDVLFDFDVNYTIKEVLRMEKIILCKLEWELLFPSVERFVFIMLQQLDDIILFEAEKLRKKIENILCNWNLMSSFRPSILALSLISTIASEDEDGFTGLKIAARLKKTCNVNNNDLRICSSLLEDLFYSISDKEN